MAILDTSAIIIRWKNKEHIADNITVVTMIEFPRILIIKSFVARYISLCSKNIN